MTTEIQRAVTNQMTVGHHLVCLRRPALLTGEPASWDGLWLLCWLSLCYKSVPLPSVTN